MSRRMYASALAGAILAALAIGVAVSSAFSSSADKTHWRFTEGQHQLRRPKKTATGRSVATFHPPRTLETRSQITANVKHGTPNTT